MKQTLLLVFIHGFKGTDHTFENFPSDLRSLLAHTLPKIEIQSVQYPRYETRGDLKESVARFKEWLQNRVIDIEVENRTPSPTVDPSVRVILCGHSMGGIVAAETLLSIAKEEPLPASHHSANETVHDTGDTASTPPAVDPTKLLFPYIQAVIAFDTPYLGISPGVLAYGAEEHLNHASSAYKAYDNASNFFGWKSPRTATPQPIPNAASRGLPAPSGSGGGAWNKWGKYAAIGGAAAALAGAAGAAYINRNQISQGLAWAGSHLEFVGTLSRGAELQKRVEGVVQVSKAHRIGFADFYTALGSKATSQPSRSGSVLGTDRTFCVVPKTALSEIEGPTGSKRDAQSLPKPGPPPAKSRKSESGPSPLDSEMQDGEQVQEFAEDMSKSKGHWVKCVNEAVNDELKAHTSMFSPQRNPQYYTMLPTVRDEILAWIDQAWYDRSGTQSQHEAVAGNEHESADPTA